jgi:hypothetical protein
MVNLSGRIAVACAAAAVLLAGCGTATYQSGAGGSQAAHAAASPAPATGAPTPGACALITLTGLRSHGAIMNATNTPTALRKYQVSSDPKSFTARVSAADVTSAGIDTSGMSQSSSVVVVVNHGHFDRSQYGEDVGPGASSSAPQPEKYADWLIYLVDPNTDNVISFVLGDNNCIRE